MAGPPSSRNRTPQRGTPFLSSGLVYPSTGYAEARPITAQAGVQAPRPGALTRVCGETLYPGKSDQGEKSANGGPPWLSADVLSPRLPRESGLEPPYQQGSPACAIPHEPS